MTIKDVIAVLKRIQREQVEPRHGHLSGFGDDVITYVNVYTITGGIQIGITYVNVYTIMGGIQIGPSEPRGGGAKPCLKQ